MSKIHFGFVIPAEYPGGAPAAEFSANIHQALERCAGSFESAWMVDHLQDTDTQILECFTSLAYFAGQYPHLRFGSAVACQTFRNPGLLAKMAANLQVLSGGRFCLGIGTGWNEPEYRAFGYDFPPNPVRVTQLEEAVQIVRALWTGQPVSFQGRYYRLDGAHCLPRPVPPPPLLIGAFKPRMLRLTTRYADEWNVSSTGPTRYSAMRAQVERACADLGRDPSSLSRSWIGGCACARTREQAEALAGTRFSAQNEEDYGFVGTAAEIRAQLRRFIDEGLDTFMLDCEGFPNPDCQRRLIEEVLPHFQTNP